MELKKGEYQAALRFLSGAEDAILQAMTGVRRREDNRKIGRAVDDAEALLKKAKRELRVG